MWRIADNEVFLPVCKRPVADIKQGGSDQCRITSFEARELQKWAHSLHGSVYLKRHTKFPSLGQTVFGGRRFVNRYNLQFCIPSSAMFGRRSAKAYI